LHAGKIRSSVRSLQKLIDLYPNTPHAVEAKKLLANLPKGL
jgi:outer membrane protein assembly factor BamD (BamD/ComL family)